MKDKVKQTLSRINRVDYLKSDMLAILREAASAVADSYEQEDEIATIIMKGILNEQI